MNNSSHTFARLLRGRRHMDDSEIYYQILADFVQEKAQCETEEAYIMSVIRDLMRRGI